MYGQKLHYIRKNLNLSQEEMAQKTNTSYRAYTSYERGDRKPSFEFLEQLALNFEVNLNFFHLELFSLGRFYQDIKKREREKNPILSVRIVLFPPNFIFLVISFLFPFQLVMKCTLQKRSGGLQ